MVLESIGGGVPVVVQGRVEDQQMLLAGLILIDHAHLAGHDAEAGVQAGDAVIGRAQILVGKAAHQQRVEVVVRLAEVVDAVRVVHQFLVIFQLLPGDQVPVIAQRIGLHQQAHLEHAVHVLFGDARNHQALFGQDGDQTLLLQAPQRIPHGGAADVAHLRTELLLVEKLIGTILAVQDLCFQILVSLQLQTGLGLGFHLFHHSNLLIEQSVSSSAPNFAQHNTKPPEGSLYP